MVSFIFDAQAGETPASIAQKRALVAQIMGAQRAPATLGEGISALGDGIVANVLGSRASDAERSGQKSANDTFSTLVASLTGKGAATPSYAPATASDATSAMAGGDFLSGLINSESGGNWAAQNNEMGAGGQAGHFGRLQFGKARLQDAMNAGVIPQGTTPEQFMASPELQQAAEAWHFADIDNQAARMGLNRYYGQTIAGVPINQESIRAMAHLGGIGGAQKFITSGGQYNPSDAYGTSLSDYGMRFGGGGATNQLPAIGPTGGAPVQVAQGPDLGALMEAASNPWLSDSQKAIINSMIAQQMQQMDPAYQQQLQAGQLGIEKSQLELEALRNPAAPKPQYDWQTMPDGTLVRTDKTTGDIVPMGQFAAGQDPTTAIQNYEYLVGNNIDPAKAQELAFGGGQTINVGGNNDIGTIPQGMMVERDETGNVIGMKPIPGGPAEAEALAAQAAEAAGQTTTERYGNVVTEEIDRALELLDEDPTWTTGVLGQFMGQLKGSNADRLQNFINTVKANSAFDRLQAMRDASPTGGALGAVSAPELLLLESAIGSLERSDPKDLAYNLRRVQQIYSDIVNGPQATTPTQPAAPANQSAPSDIDDILKGYGL